MSTKAWISALALAAAGIGCGGSAETTAESTDETSEELRLGHPKIIEVVEQENYVSDQDEVEALAHDKELVNAWGLAFNPDGPAWVSSNGRGLANVYNSEGTRLLRVKVPTPKVRRHWSHKKQMKMKEPSAPTGQVFNGSDDFKMDRFIIVTEDGTVAGWQRDFGMKAKLRFTADDGAIYKGNALAHAHDGLRLYVADFHNNKVDVFDDDYKLLKLRHAFEDDRIPCDFAPFNIFEYKNLLFVTYAKQDDDKEDDVPGLGNGFVDVFDAEGRLLDRLIKHGQLDSPWGVAVAPSNFGKASNKLLVGNFGNGRINAYDLTMDGFKLSAKFAGALGDSPRHALVIDGLWAVVFGLGAGGFEEDDIYFTAGPGGETHGLFGELGVAGEDGE
jgi:uncharacterized protein (TIGR03118 family)